MNPDEVQEQTSEDRAQEGYTRRIRGHDVDMYTVLRAFKTGCPSLDHAVKKIMFAGQRNGGKSREQDLLEAIKCIERSIEEDRMDAKFNGDSK